MLTGMLEAARPLIPSLSFCSAYTGDRGAGSQTELCLEVGLFHRAKS